MSLFAKRQRNNIQKTVQKKTERILALIKAVPLSIDTEKDSFH